MCGLSPQLLHAFTIYFKFITKVRQVLLQSATAFFITKCDGLLLQSATAFLLQSATSVITKCDRYYKVWQFYYKVRQVLQSATIITKCDSTYVLGQHFKLGTIPAEKEVFEKLFLELLKHYFKK